MPQAAYPNGLTGAKCNVLFSLLPAESSVGRPRKWSLREIPGGTFDVLRGGIAWRAMPHDLPPGQTIYHGHRIWRVRGVWEALHTGLREVVRQREGRAATPSAAILDSPSVRTTGSGGPRGQGGGRKSAAPSVTCSSTPWDSSWRSRCTRHLWADAGYTGKLAGDIKADLSWTLEIIKHPWSGWQGTSTCRGGAQGFCRVKRRWVVERTFAWLGQSRRMAKDDEALVETAENLVYEVMIRLTVCRPAKPSP
ncbi:transposase (plasmid) [Deinococcus taeanensis]|uniref:transposase n=1 Tax=Deinococcus taeanensis TaxID=2737050 RepID=UPI001CDB8B03|nr:transposase [Deinococcus taeanensis]UBV45525.1 transposase [Deinococcus taeanensis]